MKILNKIFSSKSSKTKNYKGSVSIEGSTLDKNSKTPEIVGKGYWKEIGGEIFVINDIRVVGDKITYNVYSSFLGRKLLVASPELPLADYTPNQLFNNFGKYKFF